MKDNKHIQKFNEHQENLNISDVSDSVSDDYIINGSGLINWNSSLSKETKLQIVNYPSLKKLGFNTQTP